MATVPTYDGPQVQTRALSFDQGSADSFGGIQGKEASKLAEGVNGRFGLANTLDGINDREVTRQVFDAEAKTKEAYVKWSAQAITDGQGAAAKGIAERSQAWWAKASEEASNNMGNPQAQMMFGKAMRTQSIASLQQFSNFEHTQLEADLGATADASVLSSVKLAAAIPTPENIALQTNAIKATLNKFGGTRWSPEVMADKVSSAVSGMNVAVFNNLFTRDAVGAKVFYEEARKTNGIDPRQFDEIEGKLKTGVADQVGGSAARQDITLLLADKKPTDAFPQKEADDLGVARFAGDPASLKAYRVELDRQAGLHAGQVSKVEASSLKAVNAMVAQGTGLADIKRTPEWSAMSPTTQVSMAEHITDRAYTMGQRARSQSIQGEEDVIRAEQRQERAMAPKMLELAQPQNLMKLSQDQIVQLMPTIGAANVDKLLTRYKSYQQNQATLSNATLDNDAFNNALAAAGLDPKPNHRDQAAAATVVRARNEVEQAVSGLQLKLGRPLTRLESEDEIKRVVNAKALVPGWFSPSEENMVTLSETARKTQVVTVPFKSDSKAVTTLDIPVSSVPTPEFASVQKQLMQRGLPYDTTSVVRTWHATKQSKAKPQGSW